MFRLLTVGIAMALVKTMDCQTTTATATTARESTPATTRESTPTTTDSPPTSTTTGSGFPFDAFQTIQAERCSYYYVAEYLTCPSTSVTYMGNLQTNARLGYYRVDFGSGAQMIQLRVAAWDQGVINVHLDWYTDEPIVRIPIQKVDPNVCSFVIFQQFLSTAADGLHDVYFTFDAPSGVTHFVNIDWFTFEATS